MEVEVQLTPPKRWVFWVSVVLAALGVIGSLVSIPVVSGLAFWLVVLGFILLALGNSVKGL
jgi:hypothetical protein